MNLPRFIFLIGQRTNALARAITSELGPDSRTMTCDLQEPIKNATTDLFFQESLFNIDLDDPAVQGQEIFKGSLCTVHEWMVDFHKLLKERTRESILGDMAVKFYLENGHNEIFNQIIYTNPTCLAEIHAFVDAFSAAECIIINVGSLVTGALWRTNLPGVRFIWLAMPEVTSQMAELRRALEPAESTTQ